jgi:hypothetical protein
MKVTQYSRGFRWTLSCGDMLIVTSCCETHCHPTLRNVDLGGPNEFTVQSTCFVADCRDIYLFHCEQILCLLVIYWGLAYGESQKRTDTAAIPPHRNDVTKRRRCDRLRPLFSESISDSFASTTVVIARTPFLIRQKQFLNKQAPLSPSVPTGA